MDIKFTKIFHINSKLNNNFHQHTTFSTVSYFNTEKQNLLKFFCEKNFK